MCDRLSEEGFALRAGLHCAPSIHPIGPGTLETGAIRASVGIYNTEEEIDRFVETVGKIGSIKNAPAFVFLTNAGALE